jgi:hypothetical protein
MNSRTRHIAFASIAAATGLGAVALLAPEAHSQVQATPSYVPIGVSASGSGSTVWFHEPFSRQALVCHSSGSGAGLAAQCITVKLP